LRTKSNQIVSWEAQLGSNVARAASIAVLGALAGFAGGARTAAAQTALSVEVLSSRPDLVTGGDALVRILSAQAPKVTVGAGDVSANFRRDQNGRWVGLVDGLKEGANQLVAKAAGQEATVTLARLSADSSCAAPVAVKYFYRNNKGDWKPLDPKGARPADVAITKTTEGREVPLIIRHKHLAQFAMRP
jgi:Tannase-like family of unknown function (DUF6351)